MPWWDPLSDPEMLDCWPDDEDGYGWLRKNKPKDRTSTFDPNSERAKLGQAGEIIIRRELRVLAAKHDMDVEVQFWKDAWHRAIDLGPGPEGAAYEAIHNSKNGDIYIIRDDRVIRSIEVKTSMDHYNATITASELEESEAEFLVGVTKAGIWCCTMEEARKRAEKREGPYGDFWVVPHDAVKLKGLIDILK